MSDYKPKLIEVALPLQAINEAAGSEGSIGARPHPKNVHRWWARRPVSAARAVIWASLVDDPSADESLTEREQEEERSRLFRILEDLVAWREDGDDRVFRAARKEIERCFPESPPPILDPFGGGGTIPLEAQRLGLQAISGDLNPVAALIQKAMLVAAPRFAGRPPVHPESEERLTSWEGAQGLAADVLAYGVWMREEAYRRIGNFYQKPKDDGGNVLQPIAWIWARTVESPDPTWSGHVPLVASWDLFKKRGKQRVWVEPVINYEHQQISYEVRQGGTPTHERTVDRGGGTCLPTGSAMPFPYIRDQFVAGRASEDLIAIVCEGPDGRTYVAPTPADVAAARRVPSGLEAVSGAIFDWPGRTNVVRYGMGEWNDLFTDRQRLALSTFSDLVGEVRAAVEYDAASRGYDEEGIRLRDGGRGAAAYADAIATFLAFNIDKFADFSSTISAWNSTNGQIRNVFARQAIPMTWDFAEVNPFSGKLGSWDSQLNNLVRAIESCLAVGLTGPEAIIGQLDAKQQILNHAGSVVSTDPPYYDNICYSDLSDFFYVWLRRNLADIWPSECATLATPKAEELIANPYRAGTKRLAEGFFEDGMREFMQHLARNHHRDVPATLYYAYKATETQDGEVRSTGWDTFLQSAVDAGLRIMATWPLRTERKGRTIAIGSNALASSIVLVCRPQSASAPLASRGEFIAALRAELPEAVRILQTGNIAPVDLPQSTIGPGIKVFSRYAKVVEADGSAMKVSAALSIINDVLADVIDGEESELDADTRFAVSWYSQYGWNPAGSGDADGLARAKNTSLDGLRDSGIGEARAGKFRLYERDELEEGWDPTGDERLTVWEATQYLVAALERSETEAAELLKRLGGVSDRSRQLTYVLFQRATGNGWADEAAAYNGLITAWPALQATAATLGGPSQDTLL